MNLLLTTCQAHNTFAVTAAIADYLTQQINQAVQFVGDISWQDRYRQIGSGQIQIGWICGYPYVQATAVTSTPLSTSPNPAIELLALPVMAGARYQNRPIYFSDVVVRHDSPFVRFADLRGARWAYNEIGSQSGYHIVRHKLAQIGENGDFFGKAIASGGHVNSLALVLAGEVEASAIDSTVLEMSMREDPTLAGQIRVLEALGPSPIPPWVIHTSVPAPLRQSIRQALTQLHLTPAGREILALGELARFETAVDAPYDPIRQMLHISQHIQL
ncbi:MAG: PhnD/SsuA/transferrin family substrate-binding protein [Anaerolineales bacterium]|nr:PhnD/SsuA/transferrin family substrate-binding protein [Anaerolineales bacterium]